MLFETFGHLRGLDMRKKRKNLMRQTRVSDKIIANKDKIYRISDPIQLAEIFYPAKNAGHRRAAFLAIFFEIKNAKGQRLESTDYISEKYKISQSSINKARTKMSRLGLIRKREGYWIFSTVFFNTLDKLKEKVMDHQYPAQTKEQIELEKMYVEMVKGEKKTPPGTSPGREF
jgi:hypothetical protein